MSVIQMLHDSNECVLFKCHKIPMSFCKSGTQPGDTTKSHPMLIQFLVWLGLSFEIISPGQETSKHCTVDSPLNTQSTDIRQAVTTSAVDQGHSNMFTINSET